MYNWIETTFNVSGGITQVVAVILALAVVLLLFGLFIFILKRLTGVNAPQSRNRQPRIAVMDSAPVDTKRRLVLIRRDNIEHLILVGGPSDVVVEQNIIRNAPLTTSRPGTFQGMGLAGHGQIKSPMAPGPEIPFRPDEHLPEEDAGTLAAQATPFRPHADVAEPDPLFEEDAAALPVPEPASPVPVPAPVSRAPVARAQVAPESAPIPPVPPRPAQSNIAAPAAARPLRADPKSNAGNGSTRAADLLRAATQNGFNRALSRTPALPVAAPDTAASDRKAPEVKTGPAMPDEGAMASADKPAADNSSSRAFPSRERPTYAGHSITPPASGPAARAKTALLKPAETPSQRVEPALAPQDAGTSSPPPRISAEAAHTDAEVEPVTPVLAAAVAEVSTVGVQDSDPVTGDLSDVTALASDPAPDRAQEAVQVHPQAEADTPAQTTPPQDPGQREIVLDLDHLIAEPAPEVSAEASADSAPETPEPQDAVQTASLEEEPAPEKKLKNDNVKPVAKPAPVRSDKNPIEEEMAKILDELGGQPN